MSFCGRTSSRYPWASLFDPTIAQTGKESKLASDSPAQRHAVLRKVTSYFALASTQFCPEATGLPKVADFCFGIVLDIVQARNAGQDSRLGGRNVDRLQICRGLEDRIGRREMAALDAKHGGSRYVMHCFHLRIVVLASGDI